MNKEFDSIIGFNYPVAEELFVYDVRNGYRDDISSHSTLPEFTPEETAEIRQIIKENPNAAKYIIDILKALEQ